MSNPICMPLLGDNEYTEIEQYQQDRQEDLVSIIYFNTTS